MQWPFQNAHDIICVCFQVFISGINDLPQTSNHNTRTCTLALLYALAQHLWAGVGSPLESQWITSWQIHYSPLSHLCECEPLPVITESVMYVCSQGSGRSALSEPQRAHQCKHPAAHHIPLICCLCLSLNSISLYPAARVYHLLCLWLWNFLSYSFLFIFPLTSALFFWPLLNLQQLM